MSEQLYRWVKASERLPEKPGRYFVKVSRRSIPDNGEENQVATFTSHKEWYLENHHHSRDFYYINPDEWLEPIPSPGDNQSLEEAAMKWAEEKVGPLHAGMPDNEVKAFHLADDSFLAGAAYVKGGEELDKFHTALCGFVVAYAKSNNKDVSNDVTEFLTDHLPPSRPSLDIDRVVEELRAANPATLFNKKQNAIDHEVWEKCCDKLQELLNQK